MGMTFAIPAMIISTMVGLDQMPRVLLKTARVHQLGGWETVTRIVLPSAFPHFITGVKLVVAYVFIGIIAGEFIMANIGVGHAIAYAYEAFDNQTMYALMLLVLPRRDRVESGPSRLGEPANAAEGEGMSVAASITPRAANCAPPTAAGIQDGVVVFAISWLSGKVPAPMWGIPRWRPRWRRANFWQNF